MSSMTEATTMTEAEAPKIELRVADRCDAACGAQAFVVVARGDLSLFLCGHHYARHEDALVVDGWVIAVDDRPKINARPSPSS